jgi:adenylate cyclase
VLVGTTAPGLLDLRVTPVGETYPGWRSHANLISGLLDSKIPVQPRLRARVTTVVILMLAGLTLAFALPMLSATKRRRGEPGWSSCIVVGANFYLFLRTGWCCRWRRRW